MSSTVGLTQGMFQFMTNRVRGIAFVLSVFRSVAAALILCAARASSAEDVGIGSPESGLQPLPMPPNSNEPLPAWSEGYLYIHHISTGKGNSAYFVFPDGTTMLIDAGDQIRTSNFLPLLPFDPKPDAT